MSFPWTRKEYAILIEMWNDGATLDAIMDALPRHAGVVGIQKTCSMLRKKGYRLENRQKLPDAVRKERQGTKTNTPQGMPLSRPVVEKVDPFVGVMFEDDPRALLDGGFARIIPQVSDWISLTGSSAALAVRSE